jgi:hypothetical protein
MSKPAKFLKLDKTIELLHHRESRLVRMQSAGGPHWFVLHGGAASCLTRTRLRSSRPDVRGNRDGLFPAIKLTE